MSLSFISKSIFLGLAVIISALIFLLSAQGFSDQGKYVEVKGLSERIVKADQAIWSINFEVKSNDVITLYQDIEKNTQAVETFLTKAGFSVDEISVSPVYTYQDTYVDARYRYNANVAMSVYTPQVDLVRSTSQETVDLIQQGIVLGGSFIDFQFTDINSIKPEMLAEAVANARVSADQFANDSDSNLGEISRANQGVFDITDKDPGSPEYKKIRVVSTVRFLLK